MSIVKQFEDVISSIESEVCVYSRMWPDVFTKAKGAKVWSGSREYTDFFAAAGSLNYGHNDPDAQLALIDYIRADGILQSLDIQTSARRQFLTSLSEVILEPRGLESYRVMFTGPTGTNAVEAALKCARLKTGRTDVIAFANGFHGVSLGSLAATSNASKRNAAGVPLLHVSRFPFDNPDADPSESLKWFEQLYFTTRSRPEHPAAVLMEFVQGEGGVNVASKVWARGIASLCHKYEIPLIADEIQTGCGRTGPFFAFEAYEVRPDIITVSKSLSGLGLPLSVVLLREDLDLTSPGQHNGTFRGNNASFITAAVCLEKFWRHGGFEEKTARKAKISHQILRNSGVIDAFRVRGSGLMIGIDLIDGDRASHVVRTCFDEGLLVETAGASDEVVKILPPLTIADSDLAAGVELIAAQVMNLA